MNKEYIIGLLIIGIINTIIFYLIDTTIYKIKNIRKKNKND